MIIYIITRSEEHCDYVETAFKSKSDAEDYCQKFNNNEDEYHRHITKIELK